MHHSVHRIVSQAPELASTLERVLELTALSTAASSVRVRSALPLQAHYALSKTAHALNADRARTVAMSSGIKLTEATEKSVGAARQLAVDNSHSCVAARWPRLTVKCNHSTPSRTRPVE